MDSFESRLRLALAQDRADYAVAPGMDAKVHRVTRRRTAQRRAVLAAGGLVAVFVAVVPLRTALTSPVGYDAPEAISTRPNGPGGSGASPDGSAPAGVPGTAGSTGVPSAGGTVHTGAHAGPGHSTPSTLAPRTQRANGKPPVLKPIVPGTTTHPPFPVVKVAKKPDPTIDLISITTANASAVASVAVVDVAVPEPLPAVAKVLCAVAGPDRLTVGDSGSFTATAPDATSARWSNGTAASTPYTQTFTEAGTYEVVLEVTYDGVASMQCHRSVVVDPLPPTDPVVTEPEPEPTTEPTDPNVIDPASTAPPADPAVLSADSTEPPVGDDGSNTTSAGDPQP